MRAVKVLLMLFLAELNERGIAKISLIKGKIENLKNIKNEQKQFPLYFSVLDCYRISNLSRNSFLNESKAKDSVIPYFLSINTDFPQEIKKISADKFNLQRACQCIELMEYQWNKIFIKQRSCRQTNSRNY